MLQLAMADKLLAVAAHLQPQFAVYASQTGWKHKNSVKSLLSGRCRLSVRPPVLPISCRSSSSRFSCSSSSSTSSGGNGRTSEEVEEEVEEAGPAGILEDGDEVYVASIPLKAPKAVRALLKFADEIDFAEDFQHFMTIIKPAVDVGPCTVLDFQPLSPEDPMSAVAVMMGRSIPGILKERVLSRLPSRRCWLIGKMKPGLGVNDAIEYSRQYNTELNLGINDCRHHTLDLVEYLTGKKMSHIEDVREVQRREFEALGERSSVESVEETSVETPEEILVESSMESPVETPGKVSVEKTVKSAT